jgi:hypothetical protein
VWKREGRTQLADHVLSGNRIAPVSRFLGSDRLAANRHSCTDCLKSLIFGNLIRPGAVEPRNTGNPVSRALLSVPYSVRLAAVPTTSEVVVMHALQKVARDRISRGRSEDGVYWTFRTKRSLSVIYPFRNGGR